jgi:ribosomal protein S1
LKKGGKKGMSRKTKKKEKKSSIKSMEDLLKKEVLQPPKKGEEIEAKIVSISKKHIFFDIGWKCYAVLGELEIKEISNYISHLKAGDKIKVRVVVEESKEGFPVVSMRNFFEKGKWEILERKQEKEEDIEVIAGEHGKGGVFVDFMGVRGVIPKIQLSEEYIESPKKLKGKKIKVRVLEVDQKKNRLVVSQKAAALGISYKKIKEEFEKIKVGGKYKAKVIGFSDFGIFCEVGKIEGLIHISEISWEKVTDPTRHVRVGSIIDVVVTEKNAANLKLNLSIKRLTSDPWEKIEERYPKDKEFEGTVIRRESYGYIVKFEPGVEGLIHVSKLAGNKELKIGEKVKLFVEKIDLKNRRMSLIPVVHKKPVAYR